MIREHFRTTDIIAGVATGAIAHAALVAEGMGLPLLYVRSSEKSHGLGNQIEGDIRMGTKAVVVEDLISTGGSSLNAVSVLQEAGLEVLGMTAIFTYGFSIATENFRKAGVPLHTLGNYQDLIKEAAETGYVKPGELDALEQWRQNPAAWRTKSP